MPTKVRLAVGLMWLIWVQGAFYLLGAWLVAIRSGLSSAPLGVIYLVVLALGVILIRAVTLGRNWARFTYSGLAVIAVGSIVREWFRGGFTSTQLLIGAGLVIAYSTILAFLFHSSSGPWFNKSGGSAT